MSRHINFPYPHSSPAELRAFSDSVRKAFGYATHEEALNYWRQHAIAEADLRDLECRIIADAGARGYELPHAAYDSMIFGIKKED